MKGKVVGVLTSAAILIGSTAHAYENEPDGFRGIKWGSSISANKKEMQLAKKGTTENYYRRKGDKLSFGGAQLEQLAYGYWDGKFISVHFKTSGAANRDALLEAFRTQFGAGDKPTIRDEFWWRGSTTTMSVSCTRVDAKCDGFMLSTDLTARKKEGNKAGSRQVAQDF